MKKQFVIFLLILFSLKGYCLYETDYQEKTKTPPPPKVDDIEMCEGDVSPLITAEGENIRWYVFPENYFIDDRDQQKYDVVYINHHFWMAGNLNFYVPSGSWYYKNDSVTYSDVYGRLYNLQTSKEVCPRDWRLPSKEDWEDLINYSGGYFEAGAALKDTVGWYFSDSSNIDLTGFNALPGGYYQFNSEKYYNAGYTALFRSTTDYFVLYSLSSSVTGFSGNEDNGYSVRCIWEGVISGNNLAVPFTKPGVYEMAVTQTVNGKESDPYHFKITINPNPDPPVAHSETVCSGFPVPAMTAACQNLKWYDTSELDEVIFEGNHFETGKTDPGRYVYYVTQTVNGCQSKPDSAVLTIKQTPPKPEGIDVSVCENEKIPALTASEDSLKWYSDNCKCNLLKVGKTFEPENINTGEYQYYVTQTVDGCESEPDEVELRVRALPEVELGDDHLISLKDEFVFKMNNSALNFEWNDGTFGDSLLVSGNELGAGDHIFWVTASDSNHCSKSDYVLVTVTSQEEFSQVPDDRELRMKIFPNPASSWLTIETPGTGSDYLTVKIMNNAGMEILEKKIQTKQGNYTFQIPVSGLPAGVYTITVKGKDLQYSGPVVISL